MPFGPVPDFDLVALEERVLGRWREKGVPGEVLRLRAEGEPWIFYEGPPTANATPGVHHVWARVFKDLYPRFHTMRGRRVPRKGGWDCHGLPVELQVERELGLTSKPEIEKYGVAAFNDKCRDAVARYVEDWVALTERSGVWIDTDDAYWTLDNRYIESVWWLVRRLWDRGLLYEGHRVSPYCPRCGTALSSHEMGQPGVYQDVTDPSVYVRFPLDDEPADLVVWTTTPWTLLSNVAAAVGAGIEYVRVHEPEGRDLLLAAAAAERIFGADAPYDVVWRGTGAELVGRHYRRPFPYVPFRAEEEAGALRVVATDFVSTEEGTGIVHLAPAFGEDDAAAARVEELPVLNPVGPDGTFDESAGPFAGLGVKAADPAIVRELDDRSLLVREQPYLHSYPHCWRCGTPLIYWAKTSWFVRTEERRGDLLRENAKVNWQPEHIKEGRFGNWLEHNVDWALSRDRYWGTPLPVWRCERGHDTCVGSVAELAELAGRDLRDLDLHRPHVDEVTFTCPAESCGETASRLAPVLDAWFDSGSMPSAQHHHPFEDAGLFEASFPADFICEAIDQTRGWFYTLLAVNTLVFDHSPYRTVVCLGLIVDGEGQKMSKSRGNAIDPWHVFGTHGADALRWNFFSAGQPWTTRRVFDTGIRESTRATLLTLWNVYSFFCTYADLDRWSPMAGDETARSPMAGDETARSPMAGDGTAEPTHVLDRWILGRLDGITAEVTDALDDFDALRAANAFALLVDDLSNWYVRRSRPRFWRSDDPTAHATLHRCLVTASQLLAPFCPFLAEELWGTLTGGAGSVHASDWPVPSGEATGTALDDEMATARRLVALGRAARTDAKVKVRQPLRRALLLYPSAEMSEEVRAQVADELNVKALEEIEDLGDLVRWTVVPNFRALGPRLGPKVNAVKEALAEADGSVVATALESDGWVEVAGERITAEEVEVRADRASDVALAQEGTWAVALDLELDEGLRAEGTVRELIRVLNDLRKDAGLAIADRIRVTLAPGDRVRSALAEHTEHVAAEVLATTLEIVDVAPEGAATVIVDGEEVGVRLELDRRDE